MPREKQSKGKCNYCGEEVAKNAVVKHLAVCAPRNEALTMADQKKGAAEKLYHLRVQASGMPEFWLNLEMRGSATLGDLDHYLRAIWLECCNHMSQFSFGGWQGEKLSMKRRIEDVLEVGAELTHIYDFGTSSETLVKAVGLRNGKPLNLHPTTLLVRNVMPKCECMECGQPANWLCVECLIEENVWGILCEEHVEDHPHDNYGEPVPLVNSPRMGLCGYRGPAEPPY